VVGFNVGALDPSPTRHRGKPPTDPQTQLLLQGTKRRAWQGWTQPFRHPTRNYRRQPLPLLPIVWDTGHNSQAAHLRLSRFTMVPQEPATCRTSVRPSRGSDSRHTSCLAFALPFKPTRSVGRLRVPSLAAGHAESTFTDYLTRSLRGLQRCARACRPSRSARADAPSLPG
jgi:hypothetical protein